jgi:hypothetical protein
VLTSRKIKNTDFFLCQKNLTYRQIQCYPFIMKPALYAFVVPFSCAVVGCSDFNAPFGSDGFDPLSTAGFQQRNGSTTEGNYVFKAGQYVTAASNSTAFFQNKPEGNAEADELLSAGTSMRVIKSEGSFIKVELDNGKVGYVAAALLLESQQASGAMIPGLPIDPSAVPGNTGDAAAPTDLGTGTPLPPISPPTANDLPPSSLDKQKPANVPLPGPASGSGTPKPPTVR